MKQINLSKQNLELLIKEQLNFYLTEQRPPRVGPDGKVVPPQKSDKKPADKPPAETADKPPAEPADEPPEEPAAEAKPAAEEAAAEPKSKTKAERVFDYWASKQAKSPSEKAKKHWIRWIKKALKQEDLPADASNDAIIKKAAELKKQARADRQKKREERKQQASSEASDQKEQSKKDSPEEPEKNTKKQEEPVVKRITEEEKKRIWTEGRERFDRAAGSIDKIIVISDALYKLREANGGVDVDRKLKRTTIYKVTRKTP